MPGIFRFIQQRAVYAWLAFVIAPAALFGHALAPGTAVFKGQDLGVVLALGLTLVCFVAWLPYRAQGRLPRIVLWTMLAIIAAWLIEILRTQADGALFNISSFALPTLLILLLLKPPSSADIRLAGMGLFYAVAIIALVSLPLGFFGLMPSGFEGADNGVCRLSVLCDLVNNLNRWSGPFGSVNYAAPMGAVLIVYGAVQRRHHAWFLISTGVLVMVLSQGRTALFAAVAGLAVVFLFSARVSQSPNRRVIRVGSVLALLFAGMLYLLLFDPSLNGRVGIWENLLRLWRTDPWTGLGTSGITANVERADGVGMALHGHSVILDQLIRWGPGQALLTIAIFVLILIAAARALPAAGRGPLAVAVTVVVSGLVETMHDWTYWSIIMAMLVWSLVSYMHERTRTAQAEVVSSAA
ncbi:MAG: hypothetical protein Q8L05_05730 [Actinomycetota bacterium]|nr:hypothetical protein [Actinomycetota bacterium]MDP2287444.1 hypothetical protein [Actinomycetota bacterium]